MNSLRQAQGSESPVALPLTKMAQGSRGIGNAKERVGAEQAGPGQVSTAAQPGRTESQSGAGL